MALPIPFRCRLRSLPFVLWLLVIATGAFVVAQAPGKPGGVGVNAKPAQPTITLLSPSTAAVGATVTITGSGFAATQGSGTVTFNGTAATASAWSALSITVTVPVGATTGNVVVSQNGLTSAGSAFTVSSTGCTVTFADALGYTKPQCLSVTEPTVGGARPAYYTTLSGGSGTGCTVGTPCTWATVQGKAGAGDGTGADIYIVASSGAIGNTSFVGSAGNEVVIRPASDSGTVTITGRNDWTSNHRFVIWDGGPNMQIRFSSTAGSQFDPSVYFSASASNTAFTNVTFWRTRWNVPAGGIQILAWAALTNISWINSEFSATDTGDNNQHHIYIPLNGTGDGRTGNGIYFLNNVIRDTPGEAIEFRMSGTSSQVILGEISGNAFHDIGKETCGGSWRCRSAVTMAEGTIQNVVVKNNLMWDLGEGCVRTWSNDNSVVFYNNTCYNWGATGTDATSYCAYGFAGFSPVTSFSGIFRNNILYATGTCTGTSKTAFPVGTSTTNKTNNACESGDVCGTTSQTVTAAAFLSVDENNADFLKVSPAASPINAGTTIAGVTIDYFGTARPQATVYDIGAQEQ